MIFFLFYKYVKPYQTLILVENNRKSKTDFSCSASPRPYQLLCRYPGNHCESRSYTSTNRTKHVSDRKEGRKEEKKDKHIGSFHADLRVSISYFLSVQ